MIRPVRADGSIDTGGTFAPIARPRVLDRIRSAGCMPVTMLVAPAGYGKSVALRQYLETLTEPTVRFDVGLEHRTLLGFLNGLSAAFAPVAAHLTTTLPGAYQRSHANVDPIGGLAMWMQAHLAAFHGVVAIDGVPAGGEGRAIGDFLRELVERTKGPLRWMFATRSSLNLPIGTWLAYGDLALPIDEHDLRFTFEEARAASRAFRLVMRDEELRDLLALTEGWPTALGFALRSSTRATDLRAMSATTRDLAYRFLSEQVYDELDTQERELLDVAVLLPCIDVRVLVLAGFDRAAATIERLRERSAFVFDEGNGIYRAQELFREFVRARLQRAGAQRYTEAYRRAAAGLELAGEIGAALDAFERAGAADEVRRILNVHGSALLECAQVEVVTRALASLPMNLVNDDPMLINLHAIALNVVGKTARAEGLLRRALALSGGRPELLAASALQLAPLLVNSGRSASTLLEPLVADEAQPVEVRVEALTLLLARPDDTADRATQRARLNEADQALRLIASDSLRSKVLQRMGVAWLALGDATRAEGALWEALELADAHHLHSVASRTLAVLANLRLHEHDDVDGHLDLARRGAADARLAGDVFDLQMAQLRMLDANTRLGDLVAIEEAETTLVRLGLQRSSLWTYVVANRAVRAGWEGRFADGLRAIDACAERVHYDFDRLQLQAYRALFAGLLDRRETTRAALLELESAAAMVEARGPHRTRALSIARMFAAIAETLVGRSTAALRWARAIGGGDALDAVAAEVALEVAQTFARGELLRMPRLAAAADSFERLRYVDVAQSLRALAVVLEERRIPAGGSGRLTRSEREVLCALADGRRPREIAAARGRSVYTVQTHIANAAGKLGCHGGAAAVAAARERGLIP